MSKNKPKTGPTRAQQKLVAQYLLDDALDALGDHYDSTYSIRWGAACIEVAAVLGVRPGSPKMRKAREFLKKEREEARNG